MQVSAASKKVSLGVRSTSPKGEAKAAWELVAFESPEICLASWSSEDINPVGWYPLPTNANDRRRLLQAINAFLIAEVAVPTLRYTFNGVKLP